MTTISATRPTQAKTGATHIGSSLRIASGFLVLLWLLHIADQLMGLNLFRWSVYPRSTEGLIGIVSGPLIHGSWQHLISNTLPTLLLGSMLLFAYPRSRWWTLTIIWLLSGLGVWLIGRQSYHFGASGLTHGMFFFLLLGGILRRDKRSIVVLMIAFFMYSGMLISIFPVERGVSFEYHLSGAVAGSLCAWMFRRWDPKQPEKTYDWQYEALGQDPDNKVEDPIIGDQWKL